MAQTAPGTERVSGDVIADVGRRGGKEAREAIEKLELTCEAVRQKAAA